MPFNVINLFGFDSVKYKMENNSSQSKWTNQQAGRQAGRQASQQRNYYVKQK